MMLDGKRIANPSLKRERMNGPYGINIDDMSLEDAESIFAKIRTDRYEPSGSRQRVRATFARMAKRIQGYLSGHKRVGTTVTEISSDRMNDWFMQSNANCYSSWQTHINDQGTLLIRPKHADEQEEVTQFTALFGASLIVKARNNPEDYSDAYMYIGKWLDQTLPQD